MDTGEREEVLLNLIDRFLFDKVEEYLGARFCLMNGVEHHFVECCILIHIDELFESRRIDTQTAFQAYRKLGLDAKISTRVRQDYVSNNLLFYPKPINRLN